MSSILELNISDRRKVFVVLAANNLRTFDSKAAFLYEVNMVQNLETIDTIAQSLSLGWQYHHDLYRPFLDALKETQQL